MQRMSNIVGTKRIHVRERYRTARIAIETAIRSLESALLFQTDGDIRCKISVLRDFHSDLVERLDEQEEVFNVTERLEALRNRAEELSAWCFVEVPGHSGMWDKDQIMRCLDILSNRTGVLSENDTALLTQVSSAIDAIEKKMKIKTVFPQVVPWGRYYRSF
jgi:chromatin segregation and condensation protein Rec8/ScpA/Scc1 (kleisin family)